MKFFLKYSVLYLLFREITSVKSLACFLPFFFSFLDAAKLPSKEVFANYSPTSCIRRYLFSYVHVVPNIINYLLLLAVFMVKNWSQMVMCKNCFVIVTIKCYGGSKYLSKKKWLIRLQIHLCFETLDKHKWFTCVDIEKPPLKRYLLPRRENNEVFPLRKIIIVSIAINHDSEWYASVLIYIFFQISVQRNKFHIWKSS